MLSTVVSAVGVALAALLSWRTRLACARADACTEEPRCRPVHATLQGAGLTCGQQVHRTGVNHPLVQRLEQRAAQQLLDLLRLGVRHRHVLRARCSVQSHVRVAMTGVGVLDMPLQWLWRPAPPRMPRVRSSAHRGATPQASQLSQPARRHV